MSDPTGDVLAARRPVGRYRRAPRKRSRWTYWGLLAAFVIAGVVVAIVGYDNLGATPIDAEVSAYNVVDDHTITVALTVDRDHPDQAADCVLYAPAADGSEVGRIELYVPPSESTAVLNATLRTVKRATTVEVYGCSYQVPAYLTKTIRPSG
ncbi:MAG TPA: DUF4307 domain-containing protein [Pseudonocardiaceae bacterium]|nr:DUF4307 domain-containing protein [Pseudonocardiaceae bacterium]